MQDVFATLFNVAKGTQTDGRQFEHLFEDGEEFSVGGISVRAMHMLGTRPPV